MRKELKAFIMKSSAVDLAVAAVIGTAFDAIV
ncbi:MAG: MscL family protein [Agriterribacter sp.]